MQVSSVQFSSVQFSVVKLSSFYCSLVQFSLVVFLFCFGSLEVEFSLVQFSLMQFNFVQFSFVFQFPGRCNPSAFFCFFFQLAETIAGLGRFFFCFFFSFRREAPEKFLGVQNAWEFQGNFRLHMFFQRPGEKKRFIFSTLFLVLTGKRFFRESWLNAKILIPLLPVAKIKTKQQHTKNQTKQN